MELSKHKILVIGDVMVDSFVYGHGSRLSPEAPVPIVHVKNQSYRLGGACNVAANLVALGCSADICGFVGEDPVSSICRDLMQSFGISSDYLIECSSPTILKTRVICDNQHIVRFDNEEMFSESIMERLEELPNDYDAIIISDYIKGTIDRKVMNFVRERFSDTFIIVDPAPKHYDIYSDVNTITPNLSEAREMVGDHTASPECCAKIIHKKLNCDFVIITLSESGSLLYSDKETIFNPAHPISMSEIDRPFRREVAGAGDTVIAAFTVGYCSKLTLKESMLVSNVAAAITINKMGTDVCYLDELRKELCQDDGYQR